MEKQERWSIAKIKSKFSFHKLTKQYNVNVPLFILKSNYYSLRLKRIMAHHRTQIKGLKNINIDGVLLVGINAEGFLTKKDFTHINIPGKLNIGGKVIIGRGCRLYIPGTCNLNDCYINSLCMLYIAHKLEIGNGSIIAWDCTFLDDDWHEIIYSDQVEKDPAIIIGQHVWVGCGATFLKGSGIGDNSVVAADSVVTKRFPANVLIGGNPAKIVKKNVSWQHRTA